MKDFRDLFSLVCYLGYVFKYCDCECLPYILIQVFVFMYKPLFKIQASNSSHPSLI